VRPINPKVGQTVTYYDANCKPRPGVVTATAGTVISVRIGHSGETHDTVPLSTTGFKQPTSWLPS
jgi:hypothetical protein